MKNESDLRERERERERENFQVINRLKAVTEVFA